METNGQLHAPNSLILRRMHTIPDGSANPIWTLLDYRKIPCPTLESNRHSYVTKSVVQSYTNWAILAPWCRCDEQKNWKELTDVGCIILQVGSAVRMLSQRVICFALFQTIVLKTTVRIIWRGYYRNLLRSEYFAYWKTNYPLSAVPLRYSPLLILLLAVCN